MNKILSIFDLIDSYLAAVIKPMVIVLGLIVASGMVLGIVMRTGFRAPMLGLEEIILLCVMWVYMLGATLASRDRSHLSADFASLYVKNQRARESVRILASSISLIMVVAFVVWSYDLFHWGITRNPTTSVFNIPLFLSQGSIFVASVLIFFYTLRDLLSDIQSFIHAGKRVDS